MFKNIKISKKNSKNTSGLGLTNKKKRVAKHLAKIKLCRRSSFGSMMDELSCKRIDE